MPRGKPADQPALFPAKKPRKGRVEIAVDRAVKAAQADKALGVLDAALIAQARSVAQLLDVAVAGGKDWAAVALARELRETLARLRLDPTSRGASRGELAGFLADLARPDTGGPPLGDPP